MSSRTSTRITMCCGLAGASLMLGCGGAAVPPAATVGKIGGSLSAHTQAVPQGAEVCAFKEAMKPTPGKASSVTEPCQKNLKSDQLWRRSLGVMAAYGEHLEAVANGDDPETSGKLQAALTGIRGPNWIDVEEDKEKAARTAAAQLVDQMAKRNGDEDLETIIKAAAPHVRTLCEGLTPYLDEQANALAELQQQIPEKEKAPGSRRCAMLDNRPICMADSVVDRMLYANAYGNLAALESNHRHAHDAVAAFCAAHEKLESAAKAGNLSDDETGRAVVDAIKGAVPEQTGSPAAGAEGEATPAETH